MTIDIEKYKAESDIHFLHWEFGEFLVRQGNVPENFRDAVTLLGAKCLQAVERGHSCLDLRKWYEEEQEKAQLLPSLDQWEKIAAASPLLIGRCKCPEESAAITPLLFDGKLFYLHKYYKAEKEIASFLRNRLTLRKLTMSQKVLYQQIHEINTLFKSKAEDAANDPQQQAAAMALTHNFSILTGGPGTGKTTVLATILALELNLDPMIRIGLAAPTGKAAVQILDSLHEELSSHLVPEKLKAGVAEKLRALSCSTIHKLLGISPWSPQGFFNESNPLPYDLVVIDESSMVSLRLMQQLCRAIAPDCRLLLIGDQNQLAAVDAGCLLGDFCSRCRLFENSSGAAEEKFITKLVENHRSDSNPALKEFIQEINLTTGVHSSVSEKLGGKIDMLYSCQDPHFRGVEVQLRGKKNEQQKQLEKLLAQETANMLKTSELPKRFESCFGSEKTTQIRLSLNHWRSLKHSEDDLEEDQFNLALAHFYTESFRIICGIHEGDFGEINLNRLMQQIFNKGIGDDGFPVIVLRNDPTLHLNNGDIGICWGGKVYFPKWQRNEFSQWKFKCRKVYNLNQLPPCAAAYAMTIHKSQGSGFDSVIMALPESENHVLCRELIYTGISRTKKNFLLWSPKELFCSTIDHESSRWSGISDFLNE